MAERWRRILIVNGALVFLLGLLAGFPFAFLEIQKIALWPVPLEIRVALPGDVRGWRMAHMEGILNGLTLFAVAAVLPVLRLRAREHTVLGWALVVTAWGNGVASLLGPIFGARGLEFGHGVANRVMYLLFVAAVVAIIVAMVLVCRGALRRE